MMTVMMMIGALRHTLPQTPVVERDKVPLLMFGRNSCYLKVVCMCFLSCTIPVFYLCLFFVVSPWLHACFSFSKLLCIVLLGDNSCVLCRKHVLGCAEGWFCLHCTVCKQKGRSRVVLLKEAP